jgi:site-specific DNA recombinase
MAPTTIIPAAVYGRLSSHDEGGLAVDRQTQDALDYAARHGLQVVATYSDTDASGYTGRARADFDRLLADAASGAWKVLLVWKLDRLTRNLKDYARWHEVAQEHGLRLVGVRDGVDTSTPGGELTATVLFGVARQESANISARVSRKREQLAAAGKPGGGRRPWGFARDWTSHHPDEAPIVRELFARYDRGESLSAIRRDLDARGVRSPEGARLTLSNLRRTLSRPRYCGLLVHRGEVVGPGCWEPLVDRELFDRVQARLRYRERTRRPTARTYPLTGLLFCSACGHGLHGRAQHGLNASGRTERRYVCPPRGEGGCGKVGMLAPRVEDAVAAVALAELTDEQLVARRARGLQGAEAELVAGLDALGRRREELAAAYGAGELTMVEWRAARAALDAQEEQARARLSRSTEAAALALLPPSAAELVALWDRMDWSARRALLDVLVDRVNVLPGRGANGKSDPAARVEVLLRA